MTTHIALDGPKNGLYLNAQEAFADEYELIDWNDTGEQAYLHVPTDALATDEDGVPLEIVNALKEAESASE